MNKKIESEDQIVKQVIATLPVLEDNSKKSIQLKTEEAFEKIA